MEIFVSLSAKTGIVKGSRVAVRQGSDYWIATVTRRGTDDVSVQYDEGTKGKTSLRSLTHLPDNTKQTKKPQTKEQIEAIKAKMKAAAEKEAAKAAKAKTKAEPAKAKTKAEPAKAKTKAEPAKTAKSKIMFDADGVAYEVIRQTPDRAGAVDGPGSYTVRNVATRKVSTIRYGRTPVLFKTAPKKAAPKKTAEPKAAKEKQAALDDWKENFKKQQAIEDAHAAVLDPGNVVEYKGKQYHIADSRRMTRSGAGKTELTLKDAGGKLYKLRVSNFSHTLKLVRKASDTEQADAKQSVQDMNKRKQDRADAQYEKGKELGLDHNSVGDYALVKFTNGSKWVKIQKVDGTGRIGIQGSGSKLRFIEPQHVQTVSPTTSSDPAVQKAAKFAKDVTKSVEREAGLYSPMAQFRDQYDKGDGTVSKHTTISMPYVQRVRDLLEKKGFKFDGKKVYTNAETGVTVELYNIGDSFSISIHRKK